MITIRENYQDDSELDGDSDIENKGDFAGALYKGLFKEHSSPTPFKAKFKKARTISRIDEDYVENLRQIKDN